MRYLQVAILILFLGVVGVFAVQNTQAVTLRFLNMSLSAPVALLAVGLYLLGMLTGWTVTDFLRASIRRAAERRA